MHRDEILLLDCLIGLKKTPSESADIIIIDPPYNIGKDFGNNKDNLTMEEYVDWSKKWIKESLRVLKPTGTMYIYGFSEILAHLSVLLPKDRQRWLIWHYTNKNVPSLNFWQRSHESIICCWKEKPIFNRDDVREEYTDQFLKNSAGRKRTSTKGRFSNGKNETTYIAHENGALPRDVLKNPTLAGGSGVKERYFYCKDCDDVFLSSEKNNHKDHKIIFHPTQKPIKLTEKLILAAKPEGEFLVLIPFAGSGSECLVTKKLGGSFIAFEINEDYVKLANLLIKKSQKKDFI